MSKLITAKEAVALTEASCDFEFYMRRVDQKIRQAASLGYTSTSCTFYCDRPTMSRLVGRVAGAGFNTGWQMLDERTGYMQINWGGH